MSLDRALIRFWQILFLFALAPGFVSPAQAGDIAERHIFGFSPDGRYFAFEQYGTQDGSGFPYADIFIIDTITDQWVPGSPVSVLLKDESKHPEQARKQALSRAGSILQALEISNPGRLLASNPPGELSADPHRVEVNVSRIVSGTPERWTFTLAERTIASARCASYTGQPIRGFSLGARMQGGAAMALHSDAAIPKSRGCPLRYAISDIAVLEPAGGGRIFAILVSVYALGFEGPDRRFLAVTKQLP